MLRQQRGCSMNLRLESRAVGEVFVIQCHGRITTGAEVLHLHAFVGDSIAKHGDVVLQFDQVEFIDSSGLGALMRMVQAARAKKGDLKLCGVSPKIIKMLEMTHLLPQFEIYDSVEEAITAAYLGSRYSPGKAGDARPRVLCVYDSSDVRAFLREILCAAGYNPLTTANIDDAKILLRATKANKVLISSRLQSFYGRPTRKALEEVDPNISVAVLDENFASQDPGEAAEKLLQTLSA